MAQRCLYGVDKNPLAAEMAKLLLWLLTLAKDKPFTFLDHAIRCGDSLIGVHSLQQLETSIWILRGRESTIPSVLGSANRGGRPAANPDRRDPGGRAEDVQTQELLLNEATEKIERVKLAADMLVAQFLRWDQHALIHDELKEEPTAEDVDDRPMPQWLRAKKETEEFRRW